MSDINNADPEGFKFLAPKKWVLELTLVYANGDLLVRGSRGDERLKKGTPVWDDYTRFLKEAGIEPREASPPKTGLSWDDLEQLLHEVIMDVPRSQSELPRTDEIDALRRKLTQEMREAAADGIMLEQVDQ